MALTEGVFFALLSCFSFGIADFIGKLIISRTGYFRLLFFLNLLSSIPLLIYALIFLQIPPISLEMIILTALIGFFLTIMGGMFFFIGMEKGNVSIVSPITSSWGIITAALALVFLNEILALTQLFSIIIIFCGILLTSISWSSWQSSSKDKLVLGAKEAIVAMVFFGIGLFLLRFANIELGSIWSLVFVRYFAALFLYSFGKATKKEFSLTGKSLWLLIIIISSIDLIAFAGYNFGVSTELVSIVTPIVSSSPAVTFVLAYIFLKERLERNQYFGIGVILLGLIIISIV